MLACRRKCFPQVEQPVGRHLFRCGPEYFQHGAGWVLHGERCIVPPGKDNGAPPLKLGRNLNICTADFVQMAERRSLRVLCRPVAFFLGKWFAAGRHQFNLWPLALANCRALCSFVSSRVKITLPCPVRTGASHQEHLRFARRVELDPDQHAVDTIRMTSL
jgi:hypothetical protein